MTVSPSPTWTWLRVGQVASVQDYNTNEDKEEDDEVDRRLPSLESSPCVVTHSSSPLRTTIVTLERRSDVSFIRLQYPYIQLCSHARFECRTQGTTSTDSRLLSAVVVIKRRTIVYSMTRDSGYLSLRTVPYLSCST